MYRSTIVAFGAAVALLAAAPALAQSPRLPDTPAGGEAAALLAVLSADDDAVRTDFVLTRLNAGLRDQFPMEVHLGMFRQAAAELAGARLVEVQALGDAEVHLIYELVTGARLMMELTVEPEPPHLITGVQLAEVDPWEESLRFGSFVELRSALATLAEADAFSGVVLAARGGDVVFHEAYGLADRQAGRRVGPHTRFDIGSLDKLFTSVAVLRLAQEGRLELDAPIDRYIDDLGEVGSRITLRQLLQHRSGLGDYLGDQEFREHPARFRSVADFMRLVSGRPLQFEPGAGRRYSNSGFVVLGAVIEAVTGEPYHDAVRRLVLEPAGMTATGPSRDDASATGYTHGDDDGLVSTAGRWPPVGSPAGGGYSNAADLHRFMVALLGDRLLSPAYTDVFLVGFVGPRDEPLDRRRGDAAWGGGAPGLNAAVGFDGMSGRIFVVLANLDPPAARRVGEALLRQRW